MGSIWERVSWAGHKIDKAIGLSDGYEKIKQYVPDRDACSATWKTVSTVAIPVVSEEILRNLPGGRQISQHFLRIAHNPRSEEEIRQLKSENRKLMQEMKSIVAKVEQLETDVSRHTDQIDALCPTSTERPNPYDIPNNLRGSNKVMDVLQVLRVGIAPQLKSNEKAAPQLNHVPLGEEKLQSEAITCEN